MSTRRALVTGGAGFVGSTLVDRLLAEGWIVHAVDCFEPFYDRAVKERNLDGAQASGAFTLHEVDTRDLESLRRAAKKARPEVIVDFAARAGVRDSLTDPWLYIDINVRGLQNTLQVAAETGARAVFASSSSVYGADPRRPFHEDQMQSRPISPYGATKVAGEALVHAHHAITGLPVSIARLFTVFGPRQRPDLAVHRFARRILRGAPVELYDEGRSTRDYTFVDDVVGGFIRLIDADDDDLVVNLGSSRPIETSALLDALEVALGATSVRTYLPPQPGDVPATWADIGRAASRLGWKPQTSLDEGLRRFSEWLTEGSTAAWIDP